MPSKALANATKFRWARETRPARAGSLWRNPVLLAGLAVAVVLLVAGFWIHHATEQALRDKLREGLDTVAATSTAALLFWVENELSNAHDWAELPDVQVAARRLAAVAADSANPARDLLTVPAYVELLASLEPLADSEDYDGFGLVLADDNGIPTKVRLLSDHYPPLCYAGESRYAQPRLIQWAFEAAEAAALHGEDKGGIEELSEFLPRDRLAEVVLPPVAISTAELDKLQRVVIGAGINYAEHRDEVGIDTAGELLLFPKPVVPTGPYAPVRAGMQIGEIPARPVLLLDYEVELGLALLEDLDLHQLPSSYEAFIDKVAFFVANDVSDREPIILDDETGYTRGKSHPTYLPIGPWMVHGSQLRPRTMDEGDHRLRIGLEVYEAAASPGNMQSRQLADTDAMLRGPWAIVRHMSETLARGKIICMRDAHGNPRYLHDANGVIPAGSLILAGTPGGTAIREPGLLHKAELFVRRGFSLEAARQIFIEDAEQNIGATAYLEGGDRVESWVEYLGRQRWSVAADAEHAP